MKNFLCLAHNINVIPLVAAITRRKELWNYSKVRTHHTKSIHKNIDDIVLRYNPYNPDEDYVDKVCANIFCQDYPAFAELPEARAIVMGLMANIAGQHLGRVFISRLAPGAEIGEHSDAIEPAQKAFPERPLPWEYYDRYQICLQAGPGTLFICGNEQVEMRPGEAWWFDNTIPHSVINNSSVDRLALVVDIATPQLPCIPGV